MVRTKIGPMKSTLRQMMIAQRIDRFRDYTYVTGDDLAQFLSTYHRYWFEAHPDVSNVEGVSRLLEILTGDWQGWAKEISRFYICQDDVTYDLIGDLPAFVGTLLGRFLMYRAPLPGPYLRVQGYMRRSELIHLQMPPGLLTPFLPHTRFSDSPSTHPVTIPTPQSLTPLRCRNDHESGPSHPQSQEDRVTSRSPPRASSPIWQLPSRKRKAVADEQAQLIAGLVQEVHERMVAAEENAAAGERVLTVDEDTGSGRLVITICSESEDKEGSEEEEDSEEEDPEEDAVPSGDPRDGQTTSDSTY